VCQIAGIDILIDIFSVKSFSGPGDTGGLVIVGKVAANDYAPNTVDANSYINNPMDIMVSLNAGQTNKSTVGSSNGSAAINHVTAKRMHVLASFKTLTGSISKSGKVTLTNISIPSNSTNILWVIFEGTKLLAK
jgi:hypothetical protein